MNVRQLEAFRAVMSCGSVSRAAEMLNVSQPAISQLLSLLEQDCQFQLFERVNRRLRPTKEAEAMLVEIDRVFDGLNRVSRVAKALREQKWGAISIGSFPAVSGRILPRMIASYALDKPDLEFRLQSMRSISVIDAIATQQLDVGISFLPGDREEIESIPLRSYKAVCILPKGHPLARQAVIRAEDLRGLKFISLGPQDRARLLIDRIFAELGVERSLQIETGQSDAAITLVSEGAGVSVIDPLTASDYAIDSVIAKPFEPDIKFSTWILVSKFSQKSSVVDHFVAHIKKEFETLGDLEPGYR